MKWRLSKLPKYKNYTYTPRYYNERKEELKEILEGVEERKSEGVDGVKARISHGLKSGASLDRSYRKRRVRHSNYRLLLVIIFLLFLAYVIVTVYLPDILSVFSKH